MARLWPGHRPENIKILTFDGGKACVFGAFADIPKESRADSKGKGVDRIHSAMEGVTATSVEPTTSSTPSIDPSNTISASTPEQQSPSLPLVSMRTVFHNLAVKQKAVYQPTFRFRRWLESEKQIVSYGEHESIADIESHLPALKGQGASALNYLGELQKVEQRLLTFYRGSDHKFKKHQWDMRRARHFEYQLLADRVLSIVGGSIGRRYDPANPVLIGVGLGKFSIRSGLSSLDSSFLSFFVQKVTLISRTLSMGAMHGYVFPLKKKS